MPPRGSTSTATPTAPSNKFIWPVKNHSITSGFGPRSSPGGIGSTNHQGVDMVGDPDILAVMDGTTERGLGGGYGNDLFIRHNSSLRTQYGHMSNNIGPGKRVRQGQRIGTMGATGAATGVHLHFGVEKNGTFIDPMPYLTGAVEPGDPTTPGGPGFTDVTGQQDVESIAKAAAISAFLELPGIFNDGESLALKGERSLMNDQPLFPFIEQLCQASLRNFQSMPNGNFFAFCPDYFGGLNHRTPYWEISDIEVLNGMINLSDDALATHVYVVGDIAPFDGGIGIIDEIQTAGVVNVFNAFMADFMNGVSNPALLQTKTKGDQSGTKKTQEQYQKEIQNIPTLAEKDKALSFLKKYGARPYREDAPMVRSPFFEMFLAYQKFCLLWSQQFLTTFEFTFMPELFPGGLVSFPDHGIQCYIDEVVHECSYETGFVTRANLSAPSALRDGNGKPVGPRTNINEGMIRSGVFSAGGAGVGTPQAKSGRNSG